MGWSRVSDTSQVVAPGEEITVKVLRVDDDTQKIALGLKQLTENPWTKVDATYEVGQVRTGRVTRVAEFGAFVELEPGVEGLAHVSTFAPTGRREEWSRSVPVGLTGTFEILSIAAEQRRIGLALVDEGSPRAGETTSPEAVLDAREADELREYSERADAAPAEGFGSLGSKLRGALGPREK
jgi:ribosomal protein S1